MFIHEYGSKEDPLVLLLAPMMVSGEDLYQPFRKSRVIIIRPNRGSRC